MQNFDEVHLIPQSQTTHWYQKRSWLFLGGVFLCTLILSGSFFLFEWLSPVKRSTASAITATVEQPVTQKNPQVPPALPTSQTVPPRGVAGATDTAPTTNSDSTFSLVSNDQGSTSQQKCQPSPIFQIGDREVSPTDSPVDEFNWSGALDVLTSYPQPFVIGTHTNSEFPWRTDVVNATPITIQFEYTNQPAKAELILSWSPGTSNQQMIAISLDGQHVGSTEHITGSLSDTGWEHLLFTSDKATFPVTPGTHILSLEPLTSGGDAVVWDYLSLNTICP